MTTAWITGARGFIGRHLSRHLNSMDQAVIGIGHGTCPEAIAKQDGLNYWLNGEITHSNLQILIEKSGYPDIIYHLAGGSSVGLSLQTPQEDFQRTVVSTASLLEWLRTQSPQTHLVLSSSAAIYGNTAQSPIQENGHYTPYSPYGFHKRTAELLCQSYAHNFGVQIAIVRLFSIYGPGLQKQLLWDLCTRMHSNPKELHLHGTGKELRDWLYIGDAVKFLVAASHLASTEPFVINGATGTGTCVEAIVDLVCQAWKVQPKIIFSMQQHTGNPFSLIGDTERSKQLYISSRMPLKTGIEKYVHWFQSTR